MSRNLNNYETVKQRKLRLKLDFPNSVAMPIFISDPTQSHNYALIGALIWKDKKTLDDANPQIAAEVAKIAQTANPQNAGIIMSTIAMLMKADSSGYSLSIAGGRGADRNAWVENAEESAVGRALDNLGYHSNSPSREEMEKLSMMETNKIERNTLEEKINDLMGRLLVNGFTQEYLYNLCSEGVRPFNSTADLSHIELEKIAELLESQLGVPGEQHLA